MGFKGKENEIPCTPKDSLSCKGNRNIHNDNLKQCDIQGYQ